MYSHDVDTRWFKNQLADKRLSQRQLAKQMQLDPAAVSLMLRGMRKISASEAAELARLLGVPVEEVMLHCGSTPTVPAKQAQSVAHSLHPKEIATAPAVMSSPDMLELPVPMSDGTVAKLLLPRAITKQDAERIAALVSALALSE